MKFSEFAQQNNNINNNSDNSQKTQKDFSENVENLYDKYKNFTQDELLQELAKNVANQKQNGTFDFDSISKSINAILPYLSEEQRQNILSLLSTLK